MAVLEYFCRDCVRFFTVGLFFIVWGGHNPIRCPSCKSITSCIPAGEIRP